MIIHKRKFLISLITIICLLLLTVFVNGATIIQSEGSVGKADTPLFEVFSRGYYICIPNANTFVSKNYKLNENSLSPSICNKIEILQANIYYKCCEYLNDVNTYNSSEIVEYIHNKDGKK